MKAVLDTRANSPYDDSIATHYHFPHRYYDLMNRCVGDWVVFRTPRAGGEGIAYLGVGRIADIKPDPNTTHHYYARIADFLMFDKPVAWRQNGRYAEAALRNIRNVPEVGLYLRGRSVRELEQNDFTAIVRAGLSETLSASNIKALDVKLDEFRDPPTGDSSDMWERQIVSALVNRPVRDTNFRRAVCQAYDNQCAITGLKIINGGGRSEVQAAHILPVENDGPDIVQNGIALSATVHWLFDRHLISISDNYRLLVSHNKIPEKLRALFVPSQHPVILPKDQRLWPSQTFLAVHRQNFGNSTDHEV